MSTGSASSHRTAWRLRQVPVAAALAPRRANLAAWLVLSAIVLVSSAVAALWARSIHTFSVMPDELTYVKQAIQIAHTGRPLVPGDFYFNSWGQLLPAVLAPVFGTLGAVHAYYTAHTVDAFLLASAAIPAYLLALELRLGRLAGCLVAALTAAVPQLVLSALVMTEDVAYPVFLWAILAMLRAVSAPSPRRDAVAAAGVALAFAARTQFIVLGPILVASVLLHEIGRAARRTHGARAALSAGVRTAWESHRVLLAVSGVAVVAIAALGVDGSASSVLGNYISATGGHVLGSGWIGAGLQQLYTASLTVGIVPLTLTSTWAAATLAWPRNTERHAFAVLLVLVLVTLVVILGSFERRFVVGNVTDRYMFYIMPLLFLGTAAWVVDRRSSAAGVALVGVAVTAFILMERLYYSVSYSILNPGFNFQKVLAGKGSLLGSDLGIAHLDPRIVIAIVAGAFAALAVVVRRRLAPPLALIIIAVPLLGYVATQTAYSMSKITTQYSGVLAASPHVETWVDRAVPAGATVGLVVAPTESLENTWETWWTLGFWNKSVQHTFVLGGGDGYAQGPISLLAPNLTTGRLDGLDGMQYLVTLGVDTRMGLGGRPVAELGGLDLYRVNPSAPLTYATRGIRQDDSIDPSLAPLIEVFGRKGTTQEQVSLSLTLYPPVRGCPCRVYTGTRGSGITLPNPGPASATVALTRSIRLNASGAGALPLVVRGAGGSTPRLDLRLTRVQLGPAS